MSQRGRVYILTNRSHSTLYTGVTSNLVKRVRQHQQKVVTGFSSRYNLDRLVYYEECGSITHAIQREKQIKAGSRAKKIALIESINSDWRDLYDDIVA